MFQMVFGIFSNRVNAEDAIEELKVSGFPAEKTSIMMRDEEEVQEVSDTTGASVASGAITGVATGGVIGGIAGLLLGVGALTIPGFGAFLIGGPLAAALGVTGAAATTLGGATTGALAGGILGALVGLGIPDEDARIYEKELQKGAILIAVPVTEANLKNALAILEENGAKKVRSFAMNEKWQASTSHSL